MITSDHKIYLSIRDKICSGQISVDTFLNIKDLSDNLNVSPLPVREALIRLASEDLLNYSRAKGYFLSKIDYESLLGAYNNMYILAKSAAIWRLNNLSDQPAVRLRPLAEIQLCQTQLEPDSIDTVLEGVAVSLMTAHSSRLFLHELRRTRPFRSCIAPYRDDKDLVISYLAQLRAFLLDQNYRKSLNLIRLIRNNAVLNSSKHYELYTEIVSNREIY